VLLCCTVNIIPSYTKNDSERKQSVFDEIIVNKVIYIPITYLHGTLFEIINAYSY